MAAAVGVFDSSGYAKHKVLTLTPAGATDGTVSVRNSGYLVIGSGSSFLDWRRRDQFKGPDSEWYDVATLISDTEMWLGRPYRGDSVGQRLVLGTEANYIDSAGGALTGYTYFQKFTALESASVTKIWLHSNIASGNVKLAILLDNGGVPGDLHYSSNVGQAISGKGWNEFTIDSTALTASTVYWLAFKVDTAGGVRSHGNISSPGSGARVLKRDNVNGYADNWADDPTIGTTVTYAEYSIGAYVVAAGSSSYSMRHSHVQKKIRVHTGSGTDSDTDLYCGSDIQDTTNFTDVRFAEDADTLLCYWKDTVSAGNYADFWVRFTDVHASNFYQMYYGNAAPDAPEIMPVAPWPMQTVAAVSDISGWARMENATYDSVTDKYWWAGNIVVGTPARYQVFLWSCSPADFDADPNDSTHWTKEGTASIAHADYNFECPHLVKFAGETYPWHLYYGKAAAGTRDWEIYVSTCATVAGTYASETKVLSKGAATDWDGEMVHEPFVFYRESDSKYVLLYMAVDLDWLHEDCSFAESSSPTSGFVKATDGPFFSGGERRGGLYSANTMGCWDSGYVGAADLWCVRWGSYYVIGYCASNYGYFVPGAGVNTLSTGIRFTKDWKQFTEFPGNPIYSYGASGAINEFASWRGAMCVDHLADPIGQAYSKYFLAMGNTNSAGNACGTMSTLAYTRATHDFPPEQVFNFFDDFSGASLDAQKWLTVTGSPAISGSALAVTSTAYEEVKSKYLAFYGDRTLIEAKTSLLGAQSIPGFFGLGRTVKLARPNRLVVYSVQLNCKGVTSDAVSSDSGSESTTTFDETGLYSETKVLGCDDTAMTTSANITLAWAGRWVAPETTTITKVLCYPTASGNVRFAIYSNKNGDPGNPDNVLQQTGSVAVTADTWNYIDITDIAVTSGDVLWIAIVTNTSGCIRVSDNYAVTDGYTQYWTHAGPATAFANDPSTTNNTRMVATRAFEDASYHDFLIKNWRAGTVTYDLDDGTDGATHSSYVPYDTLPIRFALWADPTCTVWVDRVYITNDWDTMPSLATVSLGNSTLMMGAIF